MEQNEREALAQQMKDRETLVRIDQQLQDSVKNQAQIMADLKEIFNRIERDSKIVTTLSGDIRALSDNIKFRWENIDKQLTDLNNRLNSGEEHCDKNEEATSQEREERTKAMAEEVKEREKFQQDITASIRTVGWIFGGLATLAAILSGIVLLFQVFGKLKGVG